VELTPETRLVRALDEIPGALEYVVGLNPHDFGRLRHGMMRKYMAPRITLGRIAAMVKMPEATLLGDLAALSGGTATAVLPEGSAGASVRRQSPSEPPPWLGAAEAGGVHIVDLLPIDKAPGDPLPPINAGIKRLEPGGVLMIRHKWEPQPLYDVWSKMHLEWYARPAEHDTWEIFVHRPPNVSMTGAPGSPMVDLPHLPPRERAPRLIAMFEQLRVGEALTALAERADWLPDVLAALDREHAGAYTVEERTEKDRLTLRIFRTGLPGPPG
jgi:uncharacterized protein (DUF2249 family)